MSRKQLGAILVEAGVVTAEQIARAIEEQQRSGGKLGEILVGLGFTTAEAVGEALANQLRSRGESSSIEPEPRALASIPAEVARRYKAVPLEIREDEGLLLVALADPGSLPTVDALELAAKLFVQPVQVPTDELEALLARCYSAAAPTAREEQRATRKRRVGEILLEAGVVDASQLAVALAEQKRVGGQLGQILVKLGLASEETVSRALADQTGVEHLELDSVEPDPTALTLVSEMLARKHKLAPIQVDHQTGSISVAMVNPADIVAIDELEMTTNLFVRAAKASERQIDRFLDRAYARRRSNAGEDKTLESLILQALSELEKGDDSPTRGGIAALVDELIAGGIRRDATDVHLEPDRNVMRVRYRVDGDLVQGPTLSHQLLASVVARIKILSQLDISITRAPQDGKISFPVGNRRVDLRVSTFPTIAGESVVVRVLDTSKSSLTLDTLGFSAAEQKVLRAAIQRPTGLILAVGPTGSGKTTTLYALLRTASSTTRKIITLEDPVEYELSLVTQCQINEKAGIDFANGLRAILRHDPDIVLVGEMRDAETCQMAMRASLTGHLVLSTLHANDAIRTVSRLRDMGMEPYLIASCLAVVSAQRLVRLICESCRRPCKAKPAELEVAGLALDDPGPFFEGVGCERCHGTGLRGRTALYELLAVTPEVSHLIARDAPPDELEAAARAGGMVTFRSNAARLMRAGTITLAEAGRVAVEA